MRDDLLALVDSWMQSGLAAREKGREETATALIGCAQALKEAVLAGDSA